MMQRKHYSNFRAFYIILTKSFKIINFHFTKASIVHQPAFLPPLPFLLPVSSDGILTHCRHRQLENLAQET